MQTSILKISIETLKKRTRLNRQFKVWEMDRPTELQMDCFFLFEPLKTFARNSFTK